LIEWSSPNQKCAILFFFLCIFSFAFGEEKSYRLKADHVYYSEGHQKMTASSNVLLMVDGMTVSAPKLVFDTVNKVASGTGNIVLTRSGESVYAQGIVMNLSTPSVTLKETHGVFSIAESKQNLFIKADALTYEKTYQHGLGGNLTSCELSPPHYHIHAESFEYYPDQRILGHDVILHYPIFFLPVQLWTPLYDFELGKRRIIWNFPTIGQKTTPGWGWFMQNTIDYDQVNGKSSSVFVDFFQNKGIGLGATHQYSLHDRDYGNVYGYFLKEQDTGFLNYRFGGRQEFAGIRDWQFSVGFDRMDAERINANGRVRRDTRDFSALYDDLGDRAEFKLTDSNDYNQSIRLLNWGFNRSFNKEKQYSINFSQIDNGFLNNRTIQAQAEHLWRFSHKNILTTSLKYSSRDSVGDTHPSDERLQATTTYVQDISPELKAKVVIDHLFDLDGRRVTTDITSGGNNFFYKQPEVTLTYLNPNIDLWNVSSTVIMARYQEVIYDRKLSLLKTFPSDSEWGAGPNTFIFKNTVSRSFDQIFGNGVFRIQAGYDQFLFETPRHSLFDGDALYKLSFLPSYTMNTGFLRTTSSYRRIFIPSEGNSPFFTAFKEDRINEHALYQSFTFYYLDESRYAWDHSLGYDFERDQWTPYTMRVLLRPIHALRLSMLGGFDLNQSTLQPLNVIVDVAPSSNVGFSLNHTQDLNEGFIRQSNIIVKCGFGDDALYAWQFETLLTYDVRGRSHSFDLFKYDIQTFSLIKNEHCRKIKISYNRIFNEFQILFTINAFPNESIGFKKTPNAVQFEGFLNGQSQERF
jgi:hypothetical protein